MPVLHFLGRIGKQYTAAFGQINKLLTFSWIERETAPASAGTVLLFDEAWRYIPGGMYDDGALISLVVYARFEPFQAQ